MFGNYRNIPERDVDFDYIIKPFDFTSGQGGLNLDLGDHILTATVTRTDKNREGVIFAKGDQTGGFVLYIKDNKLKYAYNVNTYRYYVAESDIEIPLGQSTVGYSFTNGEGFTATVVIFINGEKVGEVFIPEFYFIAGPITSVKQNKYTPVYPDYEVPFEFNGELNHIHIHQNEGVYDFAREIEKALARD
jgi:arylsulfatase